MHINIKAITFILRLGLAFTYIFIGILCFYAQSSLIDYASPLVTLENSVVVLSIIGIISLVLAIWILTGKKLILASYISFLILLTILLLNIEKSFVIFATLQAMCMNLALIFIQKTAKEKPLPPPIILAEKIDEDRAETLL